MSIEALDTCELTHNDFRKYGFIPKLGDSISVVGAKYSKYAFIGYMNNHGELAKIRKLNEQDGKCAECGNYVKDDEAKVWFIKSLRECGDPIPENTEVICISCKDARNGNFGVEKSETYEQEYRKIVNNHAMPETTKSRKLEELKKFGTLDGTRKSKPVNHVMRKANGSSYEMFSKGGFIPDRTMPLDEVQSKYSQYMMNRIKEIKPVIMPQLYWSQNGRCKMCNKPMNTDEVTVDHIHPLSKGGDNDVSNLQLLCETCNKHKANMGVKDRIVNPDGTVTLTLTHH